MKGAVPSRLIAGRSWMMHVSAGTFNDLKKAFLAKGWNSFQLSEEKLQYIHLKIFFKYKCVSYLKQPLTTPQHKIIVAYYTSNHRLAIEIGQWLTIPISRDNRLCHFYSYNVVENETHFVLESPMYNSKRVKFQSAFDKVVLGSLKSFFQLDHKSILASISQDLTGLTPSWCTFSPTGFLASWTLKLFHFIAKLWGNKELDLPCVFTNEAFLTTLALVEATQTILQTLKT